MEENIVLDKNAILTQKDIREFQLAKSAIASACEVLCAKAGIGCYQSGMLVQKPNMNLEDFRSIVEQSKGKCNQFALGGRGDPDQHEHFEEILKID